MNINIHLSWEIKETENFSFYYIRDSFADKNIDSIVNKEEELLVKLENYLRIKKSEKINLYLYPSLSRKKNELGGKSTGYARFEGRKVAYVYNHKYPYIATYHEETHILCFDWDKPSSYIENQYLISTASFYEGFAMHTQAKFYNKYFDRYSLNAKPPKGHTLHQAIKTDIQNHNAPHLKEILMYEGYCKRLKNGAQLGSIVDYLIEIYNIEKFKKLFVNLSESKNQKENEEVFINIYGKSIDVIDSSWRKFVLIKQN